MRKVDRYAIPIPKALETDGLGDSEKKKAIDSFKKKFNLDSQSIEVDSSEVDSSSSKGKTFNFKVYKDSSIKTALEELFKGKCAYCESRYASIHPVDIEHWRPKSEVFTDDDGKVKRYGYYWLASNWDNLLPSCIDCNRIRKHYDFLEKKEKKLGKGNWFPIANPESRASLEGSERDEQPLLLNPCIDNPEEFLEFHEEGFVKAKLDENNKPLLKAQKSIQIYALNRTELVLDRYERIVIIKQKMKVIMKIHDFLEQLTVKTSLYQITEELLCHELKLLNDFQNPNKPFSMMAKQLIDEFMKTFKVTEENTA